MSRPTRRTGILRWSRGDDRGAALVAVVGSMMVLAMLAMTALAYSMSGQRLARYDQDYSAAMAAAQSGVEEFISRMDRDEQYALAPDCTNDAWRGPEAAGANTCGWTDTTEAGWLPVEPGASGERDAYFHYAVDGAASLSTGTTNLTVTGRVNGVYRTIQATIGKGGSTDYVYYTDFESADPSNVQVYGTGGTTRVQCGSRGYAEASYSWQGRSSCQEIQFISGDVLNGDVFSNDSILSVGGEFQKAFLTADPRCQNVTATRSTWSTYCLRAGSSSTTFGLQPQYAMPKSLDDNSAAFATNPGCHYSGATRVIFQQNGTMKVWNRKSVNGGVAPVAIEAPGIPAPDCGTLDALDSAAGATVPVPDEMVIYAGLAEGVDNRQCYGGEIGGPVGKELPVGDFSEANTRAPATEGLRYSYDTNMTESTKYCRQGNLYAEGVVNGRVTISAAQSVIATGDLVLAGGNNGDDMLGLVATNSVEVFHPRTVTRTSARPCTSTDRWGNCTRYGALAWGSPSGESEVAGWPTRYKTPGEAGFTPASGILITGSIQTLQHSFLVQKYNVGGNAGKLQVYGSIAQRWRGIVGQSVSGGGINGYTKLYQYDPRLTFTRPPYFPTWANSQWSLRASGEMSTPAEVRG